MIVNVTLTHVGESRKCYFEGQYHYCLSLFVNIDQMANLDMPLGEGENWTTLVNLWDDNIQRFGALHKKVGDLLTIDVRPYYKHSTLDRNVCYAAVTNRFVWPEEKLDEANLLPEPQNDNTSTCEKADAPFQQ